MTLTARLFTARGGAQGEPVKIGFGAERCSAATNATGSASCEVTPHDRPGSYRIAASFVGTTTELGSTDTSQTFTVTAPPKHRRAARIVSSSVGALASVRLVVSVPAAGRLDGDRDRPRRERSRCHQRRNGPWCPPGQAQANQLRDGVTGRDARGAGHDHPHPEHERAQDTRSTSPADARDHTHVHPHQPADCEQTDATRDRHRHRMTGEQCHSGPRGWRTDRRHNSTNRLVDKNSASGYVG